MHVWRLVKTRHAASAFDGEGARLVGARWNSAGVRVAYASDSAALAVLEVLVHLGDVRLLPAYSIVSATIPDALVEHLDPAQLPDTWAASPVPPEVQAIGDAWQRAGRSLALRVPSAVVSGASNLLIDPEHRDFAHFRVVSVEPFRFDARLLR